MLSRRVWNDSVWVPGAAAAFVYIRQLWPDRRAGLLILGVLQRLDVFCENNLFSILFGRSFFLLEICVTRLP